MIIYFTNTADERL